MGRLDKILAKVCLDGCMCECECVLRDHASACDAADWCVECRQEYLLARLGAARKALEAMIVRKVDGRPYYRTFANCPQEMPPHVEQAVRAALSDMEAE